MFPEYNELISQLKAKDHRFFSIYEKHDLLDKKITDLEKRPAEYSQELHAMKQEKLSLKDEIYKALKANAH